MTVTKRRNAAAIERKLRLYEQPTAADDLMLREEAKRVITMFVAPGASDSVRPEDVIRAEGETDEAYAERQALAVEPWPIPDSAVNRSL
jgi:hypothetical protein